MPIASILAGLVARCAKHAVLVVLASVLLAVGGGFYASRHLGVTTDTNALFSSKLPWRQHDMAMAKLFPQFSDTLVVVIDAKIPEEAEATAASLAERLAADHKNFVSVTRPDASPFLQKEGLLFLSTPDLTKFLNQTIDAQPFIGQLVADPSARGLFSALSLVALGVAHGQTELGQFAPALNGFETALASAAKGDDHPLSWERLLGGSLSDQAGKYKFVLAKARLDFGAVEPGGDATRAVRAVAASLPFVASAQARVRITGNVAISDEEFATVAKGALAGLIGSFVLVVLWLFLALQSWRLIVPVAATLVLGLVLTATFASVAVGTLNLISVAFAILFVGIAVDFAIQFTVRFRELSIGARNIREALDRTARRVGVQILIASVATASGFLAFTPTAFVGVASLGLIAGFGMLIAFASTITFLPAALVLCRPRATRKEVGFRQLKRVDIFVGHFRLPIVAICAVMLVAGAVGTSRLKFDGDPLHTKDQKQESIQTLDDLMHNPLTTPYTTDALVPNADAAAALAKRLSALPLVQSAMSINSFVPADQQAKLALIADASSILGPTLDAPRTGTPPSASDLRMAIASTRAQIGQVANKLAPGDPLARIGADLATLQTLPDPALMRMNEALTEFLPMQLSRLRLVLSAQPVTLADIPRDVSRDWIAPDGQYRVQATMRIANGHNPDSSGTAIGAFVAQVRDVDPDVGGAVVSILSTTQTILSAFRHAATYAVVAIGLILVVSMRRLVDAACILASLLLSAATTVLVSILAPLPLNFANIIALPLLLGVGVSFNIYFVMNWRAGESSRLASPTARAVIFSALTTGTAFGSLALSQHPGTASMGKLLLISLAGTLFASLVFIPALLAMLSRTSASPLAEPAATPALRQRTNV
jgi:hopanoid biosynthesis associated RND transporter like protein HpnN